MATPPTLEAFDQASAAFDAVELPKVMRDHLGTMSLKTRIEPLLAEIQLLRDEAAPHRAVVHNTALDGLGTLLKSATTFMQELVELDDPEWLTQSVNVVARLQKAIEAFGQWLPHFTTAAVRARGLLNDGGPAEAGRAAGPHEGGKRHPHRGDEGTG